MWVSGAIIFMDARLSCGEDIKDAELDMYLWRLAIGPREWGTDFSGGDRLSHLNHTNPACPISL